MKQFILLFGLFVFVLSPAVVRAEDAPSPTSVGTYDGWSVYSFQEADGKKACFMATDPQEQKGKFKKRGTVRFFVTRWTTDKDKDAVSVAMGYPLKDKENPTLKANGQTFKLYAEGEMAWALEDKDDAAIVKSIRGGKDLVIKGVSSRGTETEDVYSLKSSSAAYKAMTDACK